VPSVTDPSPPRATHLVVVPHTHWDREWYLTQEQFRVRLVALVDELLDVLEGDPAFRHFLLDGQTIALEDYLAVRPEARPRVERLARAGRLALGPWYVLPDEWLVSGEALIRNLRTGLGQAESFGGAMRFGYVPDQFGHVGQLPQLFALFGFRGAALWRGVGGEITETPFWWEAPDGSRVIVLYLPHGYGHGAHLPLAPDRLARRLAREIGKHAGFLRGDAMLFMNGVDHAMPQRGLPEALAKATALLPGVTFEIAGLGRALERLTSGPDAVRALQRGELRSGLRSPLLPGCASARIPQKQADARNDRLLTRYLEPLSAWLAHLGGRGDPGLLDFIWRIALQNHPHDSICGCSIDRVHEQMEPRFQRVEELATAELARVCRELAAFTAAPPRAASARDGDALAVWSPNAAGRAEVDAELELALPGGPHRRGARVALHLRDGAGRRLPALADVLEPGFAWQGTFPRALGATLLPDLSREFLGWFVNAARWRPEGATLALDVRLGTRPDRALDLHATRDALADALDAPGIETIRIEATRPPRVRLRFVDDLPGHGLRLYRAVRGSAGPRAAFGGLVASRGTGSVEIANEHYRVEADSAGRICVRHAGTGTVVRDAVRFVDEGDRGDEYNFDAVPGAPAIEGLEGVRVRLEPVREAEVALVVEGRLPVPEALAADRSARGVRRVALPVRLRVRLAPGLDRVDLEVEIDNRARDHRLRLHVRAPWRATRHEVESAFEIAERPIGPGLPGAGTEAARPRAAEQPIGTSPQRSFARLDDGGRALTLANRASPEVEAVHEPDGGTSLAVTLVRAVGWLSRPDLASRPLPAGPVFETPGAQVPGPHRAALSFRFHSAADADAVAAAHRFAHPPLAFVHGEDAVRPGALADGARALEIDDPALHVSALTPLHDGGAEVRVVNLSSEARRARVTLFGDPSPRAVDLAGRPVEEAVAGSAADAPPGGGRSLRPWQILTLRTRA